jgi:acylphosphatase
MPAAPKSARRWFVRGRVQGVGYRYFVQNAANSLNLSGYATNLDDGRVEVYAAGPADALNEFAGMLHRGPRFSEVHGVEEQEAEVHQYGSFHIR